MPTLILHNARIRTMDPSRPWCSALAVCCGRVISTGADREILPLADSRTRVLDLGGRLVLPGFTESHIHYFDWALGLTQLPVHHCTSLAELERSVREAAARTPKGEWILGQGWSETRWPEGRMPDRHDLDRAAPEHPVLLWRADLHLAAANSLALELGGLRADTPDIPMGRIDRAPDGTPTGLLCDLAINPLKSRAMREFREDAVVEAMAKAQAELHALGVTAVHDMRLMGGLEGPLALRAWRRLEEEGRLRLRVWCCLPGEQLDDCLHLGLRSGLGSPLLRMGHLKYFTDGSMGARTAWMLEPYASGGLGLPLTPMEDLRRDARKARQAGLALAVHAIGDRAGRELVELFAELEAVDAGKGRARVPDRIEHLQMLRPEDLQRLAELPVAASVQPMHLLDDIELIDRELGELGRYTYAFADLHRAGVPLAFGSDCPVSTPDPLRGLHAAVTRQRPQEPERAPWYPEQRLDLDAGLKAYTLGPARACGLEAEQGSLASGRWADLVVLDRDVTTLEPEELPHARVQLTFLGGRLVHGDLDPESPAG